VASTAERQLTITNKVGLHARPAALFVQTAARFRDTRVEVLKDGLIRDAKSILSVLTLGVSQGTTITVRADGPQAEEALTALADLVNRDFDE
jgi:phosphocarrier protein HPr